MTQTNTSLQVIMRGGTMKSYKNNNSLLPYFRHAMSSLRRLFISGTGCHSDTPVEASLTFTNDMLHAVSKLKDEVISQNNTEVIKQQFHLIKRQLVFDYTPWN